MEAADNNKVIYEFGEFMLDPRERTLLVNGEPVHMPAKEFDTLLMLVEHNDQALSKEEMLAAIWENSFVEEGNLSKQISLIRKVISLSGSAQIETIPKHGYRFHADLRRTLVEVGEPLVLEKHIVKRVKIAVEDHEEPGLLRLPSVRRNTFRSMIVLVISLAAIGIAFIVWPYGRQILSVNAKPIDPYAPVRLTDNPNDDTAPHWTRDGRIGFWRIYSDRHSESWIMNSDGSGQSLVKDPDGKKILSWSPNEEKIIYQRSKDTTKYYLSNADGTNEILLPSHGGEWSNDSKMLVYMQKIADDDFDIFTYSVETGKVTNVTNSNSFNADPSFSPDGTQIAFDSMRDGNQEIYLVNIDGSKLRRLTFNTASDNHPAFSPDGTQIVFTSGHEQADIYIMNADGSDPVNISNEEKTNETAGPGSWSPDGTKLAFFSDRNGHDDIYVMSAETVRPKLLLADADHDLVTPAYSPDGKKIVYSRELEDKSGELRILDLANRSSVLVKKTSLASTSPQWSPDGNWIGFYDRIDGVSEVFRVKPDGSSLQQLTDDPSANTGPAWSPDGSKIVFLAARGEPLNKPQLYIMNADGSEQHPLTPKKGWEADPIWAPGGESVVFPCDREDLPGDALDICEINADGTGEKRILSHRDHDTHPTISPDGKRIAFITSSDGNSELYLMNRDGTGLLRLTRDPSSDKAPEWSPDGKNILFSSDRDGRFAIYEIDL